MATSLSWTETEAALPVPFDARNALQDRILQLTDIQNQFNQELLHITGLEPGSFALAIDGENVGVFPAADLAKGINLAQYRTPMRDQAQVVSWSVADQVRADQVHMTMRIKNANMGSVGDNGVLGAFENSLENAIYDSAQPKPHSFTLSPVAGDSNK